VDHHTTPCTSNVQPCRDANTFQSRAEIWRTIRLQSRRIPTITPFPPNGRKQCNQTQETSSSSFLAVDCESTRAFVQKPSMSPINVPYQSSPKLPQRYPSKSHQSYPNNVTHQSYPNNVTNQSYPTFREFRDEPGHPRDALRCVCGSGLVFLP